MIKSLLAVTLLSTLAVPALAADKPGEKTFTRDGETYVYTTATQAGRVFITGHRYPSGNTFNLMVRGDHISGTSSGQQVAFTLKGAQAAATMASDR